MRAEGCSKSVCDDGAISSADECYAGLNAVLLFSLHSAFPSGHDF
jgi:hypothetical protein